MNQISIGRNYIFNVISSVTTLLFPLVTFPYASRILLADGIGEVAFFKSIISYVTIFSALGLPLYAIREIANVKEDKKTCSKVAVEIIILHSLLTLIGYVVVGVFCISEEKIYQNISLFLLLSTSIFFNAIGAIWFYQGIEDFKYITIRGIVVRIASMILLFSTVKTKSDLMYYAAANVIAEGGGNIFNFIRLRKYIKYDEIRFCEIDFLRHLKPTFKTFALSVSTSIYLHLDSVMLGFLGTDDAVGFYTAANSIVRTSMTVVISLGSVILPRLSNLASCSQSDEFEKLVKKIMNFGLLTSIPMAAGLIILAAPVLRLFCGPHFSPSILTTQIMSPIIIAVTLSCFMMPVLYACKLERIPLLATIVGALVNIVLNFLFIPKYLTSGAAFATLTAEIIVVILMFILGRKYICWGISLKRIITYIIGTIFMVIVLLLCRLYLSMMNDVITLLLCLPIGVLAYFSYLYFQKETLVLEIVNKKNEIQSDN